MTSHAEENRRKLYFFFRFLWDNCSSWLKYYGSQSETETRHVNTESCVKQTKGALRIYSVNIGMKTFCTGYIIMLSFFIRSMAMHWISSHFRFGGIIICFIFSLRTDFHKCNVCPSVILNFRCGKSDCRFSLHVFA